jgi:tetratricopeptide (TPR) repeat protein
MRTRQLLLIISLVLASVSTAIAQDNILDRVATLESSVNAGNASRDQQIELARLYVQVGRFYEASKLAQKVLAQNPNDADATAVKSQADQRLKGMSEKKVAEAEARANAAGATDQDRLALADAYFGAGNYTASADLYSKLPASAQTRESRLRRARSLAWTSHLDEAERAYADLLAEQRTPDVELEYGRVLSWMGATRPAVSTLNSVYEASRTEASAVALANARAWSGDREGALRFINDFVQANPNAAQARQLANELATSPDIRLERISKLVDLVPFNLAVRLEMARLQAESGRYGEAEKNLQFIREHSPSAIAGLDDLQSSITQKRQQEIASLEDRRKALDNQASMASAAQNADEILSLAKTYNGLGAYDYSIPLYQRYVALRPNDFDARVQYARVLSWDRRYRDSAKMYEALLNERPDRADLRYEYASVLSYDERYVPAIQAYQAVTNLDDPRQQRLYGDVPARAYYNIGQIYRWYGWNDTALADQNRAISLDPGYNPARDEIDMLRHRRPTSAIDARYSYNTDSNDFTLRRITLDGEKWVSSRTAWDLGVGHDEFSHLGQTVSAFGVNGGGAYRFSDRTTLRGRVGANFYQEGFGTRPFYGLGATFRPSLQSRAALDFNHYDLVYDVFDFSALGQSTAPNGSLLGDPLTINDLRGHYDWTTGGHFSWLADASYGAVSDTNRREAAHGILSFELFHKPFVALKADGRWLQYDFRSPRYWSPTQYNSVAGVIQVGQDLRRFAWNAEFKAGKAHETGRTSDIRSWGAYVSVPVTDAFDLIGNYNYGRSGRFNSVLGGSGADFTNYWQRNWFVGVRLKQLFRRGETSGDNPYYFDNSSLSSTVIPPETH